VSTESKRHIKALTRLTGAVVNDADNDAKIADLKRRLETIRIARNDAVERYESHLLTHSSKTLTAGSHI
jgi:hypothetical protein